MRNAEERERDACGIGFVADLRAPTPSAAAELVVPKLNDLVADLLARSQDALCVGDGAERYRDEILDGFRCEISGPAHPEASALVQLAHARALREEWVRPGEIEPVYLRAPDAQINWATRESRP